MIEGEGRNAGSLCLPRKSERERERHRATGEERRGGGRRAKSLAIVIIILISVMSVVAAQDAAAWEQWGDAGEEAGSQGERKGCK